MATITLSRVLLASLLLIPSIAASQSTSNAQQPVPDIFIDGPVDQDKIARFKDILENQIQQPPTEILLDNEDQWTSLINGSLKWGNVTHGGHNPMSCPKSCRACSAGCSVTCCILGGGLSTIRLKPEKDDKNGKVPSDSPSDPPTDEPPSPPPVHPLPPPGQSNPFPRPIPPLSCPCHCQASCPAAIQAICCVTADFAPDVESIVDGGAHVADAQRVISATAPTDPDPSTPIPAPTSSAPSTKIPWEKDSCPCHCEGTCPAYIQAICCQPPGTIGDRKPPGGEDDSGDNNKDKDPDTPAPPPPNPHALTIVTQSANGTPLSVLAIADLTSYYSYITMDMVTGLQRSSEITVNSATGTAEIVLPILIGDKDNKKSCEQSFSVVDGTNLAEQQGVLLGYGFLARIGALDLKAGWGGQGLEPGVPLLTGTKVLPGEDGSAPAPSSSPSGQPARDEL